MTIRIHIPVDQLQLFYYGQIAGAINIRSSFAPLQEGAWQALQAVIAANDSRLCSISIGQRTCCVIALSGVRS